MMRYRPLGNTGIQVSEVSFGTWAIGGAWGSKDDAESLRALQTAMDAGVNFFDTADVYGDGHSERLLAQATKGREDEIYIATKFCRKGDIHDPANYSEEQVRKYCEDSLRNLQRETIDLYQIHCPAKKILEDGHVFEVLDKLKAEGKIRAYGVSVESVEEGLISLRYPGVQALQVIFNIFRQKPLEELFPKAHAQGVGILARLPLASGLLTGKFTKESTFEPDDHRNFNRNGESFNVGETFAGLPLKKVSNWRTACAGLLKVGVPWPVRLSAGFSKRKKSAASFPASKTVPRFRKICLPSIPRDFLMRNNRDYAASIRKKSHLISEVHINRRNRKR